MVEPEYEAKAICLGDPGRGKKEAGGGSDLPVLPSGKPSYGPPSQARQQLPACPQAEKGSPAPTPAPTPTPTTGWPLTVPQIGVGKVEGPHKSREGILC